MNADPLLAVEATLTEEARESWLRRAFEMFPTMRGAGVADVLDRLNEGDYWLEFTEPWWEQHGQALGLALLCDAPLLSGACRLAILATGASRRVPFDALAEAVARAAAAGEAGVIDLTHFNDVPDDGLYHGPELDAAMSGGGPLDELGVCMTALATRRDRFMDDQMKEASFVTGVLLGQEPTDPFTGDDGLREEYRAGLLELKATMERDKGEPLTTEEATVLALRTVIGGSWSRGIEVGLKLARNRQAKQRTWEVEEYSSGRAVLMTGPADAPAGEYVLVEQGKI